MHAARTDQLHAQPARAHAYTDRAEAGRELAEAVRRVAAHLTNPLVVALPRGGVEVAVPVARTLGAPLDVVVSRKIGAPGQPELAIGAVDEDGASTVDRAIVGVLGLGDAQVRAATAQALTEARHRSTALRGERRHADVAGRDVVLVDDGYATGMTAVVAARYLLRHGARHVVLAVPVAPYSLVREPPPEFAQVVCPFAPDTFRAVGLHYRHFDQVSDETVRTLLERERGHEPDARPAP